MKIRVGFISNSSSSSYVVFVPKDRKINFNKHFDMEKSEFNWKECERGGIIGSLNEYLYALKNEKVIWQDDNNEDEFSLLHFTLYKEGLFIKKVDTPPQTPKSIFSLGRQWIKRLMTSLNDDDTVSDYCLAEFEPPKTEYIHSLNDKQSELNFLEFYEKSF